MSVIADIVTLGTFREMVGLTVTQVTVGFVMVAPVIIPVGAIAAILLYAISRRTLTH